MEPFQHLVQTIFAVLLDGLMFLRLWLRPSAAVAAENLFLRKQLGLFVERKVKPRLPSGSKIHRALPLNPPCAPATTLVDCPIEIVSSG